MSAAQLWTPSSQLPPSNKAFREILALIPRLIETFGAASASIAVADVATKLYVSARQAYLGDLEVIERMHSMGVTETDCIACADWLQRRARELRGELH